LPKSRLSHVVVGLGADNVERDVPPDSFKASQLPLLNPRRQKRHDNRGLQRRA